MNKGLITYGRDILFKAWNQGITVDNIPMFGTTAMGTVLKTGNYKAQLKANKGIVYSCVDLLGLGVAKTVLRVYITKNRKEKSTFGRFIQTKEVSKKRKKWIFDKAIPGSRLSQADDVEEVVDGYFVQLLRHVNDYQSLPGLKRLSVASLMLTGDNYWYLIKTKPPISRPVAIWLIPSGYMKPIPDSTAFIKGYQYKRGTTEITYEKDDIVHFKVDSLLSQYIGEAPLNAAGDSVDLRQYMLTFEKDMFLNGPNPKGIITAKGNVTKEQRERFQANLNQAKQAGLHLIGGDDFTITQFPNITARDMGYSTGLNMTMEDIAQVFHVPMGILTSKDVNKANAEIAKILLAEYGLSPLTMNIDETITDQLAWQFDERYFTLFDDPVPENREAILAEWEMMLKMGVMSQNEVRAEDGKEPFEGGDEHQRSGTSFLVGEEMEEEMAERIAEAGWSKAMDRYRFGQQRGTEA